MRRGASPARHHVSGHRSGVDMSAITTRSLMAAVLAAWLAACATGPRTQAPGADRQFGFDEYWRSPQAAFVDYGRVRLAPVEVELSRDIVSMQTGSRTGLSRGEGERLRARIVSDMTGHLTKALADIGQVIVDDSGPGVLVLKARLNNVHLSPALHDTAQPITTLTRQTARAELILVVLDGASGAELARVHDRGASREDTDLRLRHPLEAHADLDEILVRWARATARMLADG